jgi:hypothetical protein
VGSGAAALAMHEVAMRKPQIHLLFFTSISVTGFSAGDQGSGASMDWNASACN